EATLSTPCRSGPTPTRHGRASTVPAAALVSLDVREATTGRLPVMTVQAAASPRGVEPQPVPRAERVAGAAARWSDELAALGGRNTLLHFRDLKAGTLD